MTESGDAEKNAPTGDDPLADLAAAARGHSEDPLAALVHAAESEPDGPPVLLEMKVTWARVGCPDRAAVAGANIGRLTVTEGAITLTPTEPTQGQIAAVLLGFITWSPIPWFVTGRRGRSIPIVLAPSCLRVRCDSRRMQMNLSLADGRYLVLRPLISTRRRERFEQLCDAMQFVVGAGFQDVSLRGPGLAGYGRLGCAAFVLILILIYAALLILPHRLWWKR